MASFQPRGLCDPVEGNVGAAGWLIPRFVPGWSISTAIGWTAMEFCADVQAALWVNCNHFSDYSAFL